MSWIQTHLVVDQSQVELLELLLDDLGALSITLGDAGDEPMLEPLPGEMPLWSATKVTALFAGDSDIDQLRSRLNEALARDISRHLTLEVLEDQDWERSWLARFQPMQFGRRLWICPTGYEIDRPDAVIVDLDPGLAFGTGTHPTTRLCLEWLDAANVEGKTLIDFGCGSGILAIAALKMGAKEVIGIDHDPQALLASRSNAEKNGVADRLKLSTRWEGHYPKADVVLANILANVLIDVSQLLLGVLKPSSELIMSGVLKEQVDKVSEHYSANTTLVKIQQLNDWCLLHVQQTNERENMLS